MAIKNMRQLLVQGAKLPATIEKALPAGAPKISTMLIDTANKVPEGPGFPIELPDLPTPPEIPTPGTSTPGLGRYVNEVRVVRETTGAGVRPGATTARFLY